MNAAARMYAKKAQPEIMVVDDEPTITHLMKHILEARLKVKVRVRNSSRRALADLKQGGTLAALITDYMMPEMNGLELAVQARLSHKDLPIIVVTGNPHDAENEMRRSQLDLVGILAKPFVHGTLIQKISDFVVASRA